MRKYKECKVINSIIIYQYSIKYYFKATVIRSKTETEFSFLCQSIQKQTAILQISPIKYMKL